MNSAIAAEVIAGKPSEMHYRSMPSIVYTWPEIASVGLAEHEVKESGREYKVGRFPFSANGRARTMGETTGFVKFIADAKTDELLGAHLIGPNVSELCAEVVLAFEYRGASEDIGVTVHSHPTLSEAVKEAALGVLGPGLLATALGRPREASVQFGDGELQGVGVGEELRGAGVDVAVQLGHGQALDGRPRW